MPFARIDLHEGKPEDYLKALSEGLHDALQTCFGVPERDRFQVITEHKPGCLVYDAYFDIEHSKDFVVVQVTMGSGRTREQKQAFFRQLAENLERSPGLRPQDLFVVLTENTVENWSFGDGAAQCVVLPRERWR